MVVKFFLMVWIYSLDLNWKLTESRLNLKKIQAKFSLQKLFSPWILTENRLKVNWIHYSVNFQFRLDWKLTENGLNNEFSQLSVKIQGLNLAWILYSFSQLSVSFQSRFSKCIQTIKNSSSSSWPADKDGYKRLSWGCHICRVPVEFFWSRHR